MIGKGPLLANGSKPFVRGGVTARPRIDLRQHVALAGRSSARNKRHAGVCAAQLDGENQADDVLQVIRNRTFAIGDMLAFLCMRVAAEMHMATAGCMTAGAAAIHTSCSSCKKL